MSASDSGTDGCGGDNPVHSAGVFTLMARYNVVADNWDQGTFCLAKHVKTYWVAEIFANQYRLKYENQPYPNGKGWYKCRNFRVVEVKQESETWN